MAEFYDVSDNETVKKWSRDLWMEFRKADAVDDPKNGLVGKDWSKHAFIHIDDLEKGPGDRVRSTFVQQLVGAGTIKDGVLEGSEETIVTATHDILIDELIHGVRTRGRMTNQRVSFDTMATAKSMLLDWWRRRRAVIKCNHLCGYTAQTDLEYTGLNAVTAIDDEHHYFANQATPLGGSNDQTVNADTNATFDVDIIDEVFSIATTLSPAIPPVMIDGNPYYLCFLHPWQVADIRDSSSQWYATMQNAIRGGKFNDNPLFTRALGLWGNVLFFEEPHITRGVHSSTGASQNNVRRAVFCGAGALQMAYGRYQSGAEERLKWFNGSYDHDRKFAASAGSIMGCNVPYYNFKDSSGTTSRRHGSIVISTYCAPRATLTNPDIDQVVP